MIARQWRLLKNRVRWSWAGLVHVAGAEASFGFWAWLNAGSVALALLLPLSGAERALLVMGGLMVLAFECLNTAVERVVDDISEARRERARQAKDAGSAAVAVAGIAVGLAWVVILWSRFGPGGAV